MIYFNPLWLYSPLLVFIVLGLWARIRELQPIQLSWTDAIDTIAGTGMAVIIMGLIVYGVWLYPATITMFIFVLIIYKMLSA